MVVHVKTQIMEKFCALGKRYRYPAMILLLGIALLLLPSGKDDGNAASSDLEEERDEVLFSLTEFTANAEALLSKVSGAGKVRLLLTLASDGEIQYQLNLTQRQKDDELEMQQETVLRKEGSDEVPVSVTQTYPVFRGAVVVCQGAQNPKVVLGMKEAISSLTGLGMDKITVLKMD